MYYFPTNTTTTLPHSPVAAGYHQILQCQSLPVAHAVSCENQTQEPNYSKKGLNTNLSSETVPGYSAVLRL